MSSLVTIIVPAFRQPAFLQQALDSLARQIHPAIEIIVIDDASGDDFTRQYRLPANAHLIVHDVNRATAAISRNEALAIARGDYVGFLDQDDLYLPEKISRQVAALEAHPDALLHFCHYLRVDEQLRPLQKQDRPRTVEPDAVRQMIRRNIIHCPAQVLMRRSAFDKTGLFDESIRGAADYDMWLRAAQSGRILGDPQPHVWYRQHGAQWHKQGVMLCRGTTQVLEKSIVWTRQHRPDLRRRARHQAGKWYRELGMAQLASPDHRASAAATLRRSIALRPYDPEAYWHLFKACVPRRSAPVKGTAPDV